ncbi:MAG TPA: DUF3574 domain-containing protein [Thermoanaerobaculia bacterium]
MRRTSLAFALTLLLGASAYVGANAADDPVGRVRDRIAARGGSGSVADRLYCGMSISGGGVVTDAEVEAFVNEVVAPRFPDGFTVWRARGAWLGGREETVIIEIAHGNDPTANRLVAEIGAEYVRRFRQMAVLRMTVPARIDFISG